MFYSLFFSTRKSPVQRNKETQDNERQKAFKVKIKMKKMH